MPGLIEETTYSLSEKLKSVKPRSLFALGQAYFDSPEKFAGFLIYLSASGVSPGDISDSGLLFGYALACLDVTVPSTHVEYLDADVSVRSVDIAVQYSDVLKVCDYIVGTEPLLALYLQRNAEIVEDMESGMIDPISPTIQDSPFNKRDIYTLYTVFKESLIPHLALHLPVHQDGLKMILKIQEYRKPVLRELKRFIFLRAQDEKQDDKQDDKQDAFYTLEDIISTSLKPEEIEVLVQEEATQYLVLFLPLEKQMQYESQLRNTVALLLSTNHPKNYAFLKKLFKMIEIDACKKNMLENMLNTITQEAQAEFIAKLNLRLMKQVLREKNQKLDSAIARGDDFESIRTMWKSTYRGITLVEDWLTRTYPTNLNALKIKIIRHALETERDLTRLLDEMCVSSHAEERLQEKAHILFSAWLQLTGVLEDNPYEKLIEWIYKIPRNIDNIYPTIDTLPAYRLCLLSMIATTHPLLKVVLMAETEDGTPALSCLITKEDISVYGELLLYLIRQKEEALFKITLCAQNEDGISAWVVLAQHEPELYRTCINELAKSSLKYSAIHEVTKRTPALEKPPSGSSTAAILAALTEKVSVNATHIILNAPDIHNTPAYSVFQRVYADTPSPLEPTPTIIYQGATDLNNDPIRFPSPLDTYKMRPIN